MRVYGYIRVSTEEQKAFGNGLEYQKQAIESYCEAYGLELLDIFSDVASGTKQNRDGLNRLLANLKSCDGVIVYHTDRLSRKLVYLLHLIDLISKEGKRLISTSQPELDLNSPTGRLMLSLLGAVAEFELSRITERMLNGRMMVKQKAKREGKHLNYGKRPPYHLKKCWTINPDGSITKLLEPDEEAIATIKLIKRHRRAGKSYYEITKFLNRHGIKNKSNCSWNIMTVKKLCQTSTDFL